MTSSTSQQLAEHHFRLEYAKLVALLAARFGPNHLEAIEEAVQEAFVEAMRVWEYRGVPDNAPAWLHTVARNKLRNLLRRDRRLSADFAETPKRAAVGSADGFDHDSVAAASDRTSPAAAGFASTDASQQMHAEHHEAIQDSLLRMMFVCCHPGLSADSRVALILKTLCGFSIEEIASAFLSAPAAIQKRLVRARRTLRDLAITMELPDTDELPARLDGVLTALYLLFNEGYKSSQDFPTQAAGLVRRELCEEAIRLLEILLDSELFGDAARVHACYALMLLNAARFDARQDARGEIVRLPDQDRSLWDRRRIERGVAHLELAGLGGDISNYHIQAAIAAHHSAAPEYAATDWPAILALYDAWLELEASPLVRLNRAVAVARVHGAAPAIEELLELAGESAFRENYLYEATLGELYFENGRPDRALPRFEVALELAPVRAERRLLRGRLAECRRVVS